MSIPPLVCSTPPPPDQCDDDKDPVDFDLPYNLSQDDDDSNNYDFGSFSTFNHYQSTVLENKVLDVPIAVVNENDRDRLKNITPQQLEGIAKENDNVANPDIKTDNHFETKLHNEDDINIEDLDLKIDQEATATNLKDIIEGSLEDSSNIHSSDKENCIYPSDIPEVNQEDVDNFTSPIISGEYTIEEGTSLEPIEDPIAFTNNVIDSPKDLEEKTECSGNLDNEVIFSEVTEQHLEIAVTKLELATDNDFGDFEDFHLASDNNPADVLNCDNPWDSNEQEDNDDFGNFKANFDEAENISENSPSLQTQHFIDSYEPKTEQNAYEDDDFGDFDDFKSSTVESENNGPMETISCQQLPVLNLHSPDSENQLMDSINKVLVSIFEEEISESNIEFEGKLESLLCETWGHLIDTDVRQPYMVNWNNSLGQKTLLKSLSIDSRNILFGPKWTSNMPKYAANLSNAPLQPQKQSSPSSIPQHEAMNADKSSNKSLDTWTDPFTSDGQESCNRESENAVVQPRPTSLDVFEVPLSTKSDKVFSSTINIQPIRQINLPDTHIFTPTDSETPRSKTIHYDSGPSVLAPRTVTENSEAPPEKLTHLSHSNEVRDKSETDDEYSEFQDFKGVSGKPSQPVETDLAGTVKNTTNIPTQEIHILQPIKIEPIMPTLNWPDPGHVKETFDDFSDFISNSSWNGEKGDSLPNPSNNHTTVAEVSDISANNMNKEITSNELMKPKVSDEFDDEFDTFQSALPPTKNSTSDFTFSNRLDKSVTLSNHNQSVSPMHISNKTEFSFEFPKTDTVSNTAAHMNSKEPNEIVLQHQISCTPNNVSNIKKPSMPPSVNQSISMGILQPTPATSNITTNQQKSGQILQPLSLESFSQINWPNPGIDLQDLSRFNPVETLSSLKTDLNVSHSKVNSPVHNQSSTHNHVADDVVWGEFVSSKPKMQTHQNAPKKAPVFVDDDEWTDFVSSPSVKPQNGLNTISLNVHTNLSMHKFSNQNIMNHNVGAPQSGKAVAPLDIPTLNYITPKSNNHNSYNDRHFQNL